MINALDHVTLVVRDLAAARERYTALLGRAPNWHGGGAGAEHLWFQLDNIALDILSPVGEGMSGAMTRAHLDANGDGIWGVAYQTPDLDALLTLLARRGIAATPAHPLVSKHVETRQSRTWRMATATIDGVLAFLIEQAPDAPVWPRSEPLAPSAVAGLDHAVIRTPAPERALATYGARLGLDLRLDRTAEEWGTRFLFFRLGDLTLEIVHALNEGVSAGPDKAWGLTWRTPDLDAAHARIAAANFNVSEIRAGRKPGTRVFTVRDGTCGVPTLMIGT